MTRSERALLAVRMLQRTVDRKRRLEHTIERHARLPPAHHRALRDVCSGTLRHLHRYDQVLASLAPAIRADAQLRLLAGATMYELEHMTLAREPRAALSRRVRECCTALGRAEAAPDLHELLKLRPYALDGFHTDASRLSLPAWLHDRLKRETPLGRYGELLLQRPDFLGLSVDPRRGGPRLEVDRLRAVGLQATASGLSPRTGVVVQTAAQHRGAHTRPNNVGSLPCIADGAGHVQDPAQQWSCAQLSSPRAGARVLDACAAPGGKTRTLLNLHPSVARVLALEVSSTKASQMEAKLAADERVEVRCGCATMPAAWWDGEPFAAILLDAPCSATGIMRTRPEVKCHQSAESVERLRATQLRMMRALWPLLADGGEMLYTTCSLLSCENERVVSSFLESEPQAESVALKVPQSVDQSKSFSRREHGVLLLPGRWHQGGFAALLRKRGVARRGVG
eukprot:6877439-Prymnesium_polylepis.1